MPEKRMANPDVVTIIERWLLVHGYDGLIYPDEECGCGVDDFVPCVSQWDSGMTAQCRAAYRHADGKFYLEKEATDGG